MLDALRILDAEKNAFTLDLMAWKDDQDGEKIIKPGLDFILGSVTYQLVVLEANFRLPGGEGVPWEATDMEILIFASVDPDFASPQD